MCSADQTNVIVNKWGTNFFTVIN